MNCYETLGISTKASYKEIKEAYQQLYDNYQLNINPNGVEYSMKIDEINMSYYILSDPIERMEYDRKYHIANDEEIYQEQQRTILEEKEQQRSMNELKDAGSNEDEIGEGEELEQRETGKTGLLTKLLNVKSPLFRKRLIIVCTLLLLLILGILWETSNKRNNELEEVEFINKDREINSQNGEEDDRPYITLDTSLEEVKQIMGEPAQYGVMNRYTYLFYGDTSYIIVNHNHKVIGWNNELDNLRINIGEAKKDADPIRLSFQKHGVIDAMGTPWRIDPDFNGDTWYYGNSQDQAEINFNSYELVKGWDNRSGVLKIHMGSVLEGAKLITLKANHNEVINVMGTPVMIRDQGDIIYWYYGNDINIEQPTIILNRSNEVIGWFNQSGNVKIKKHTIVPGTDPITLESTQQEVLNAAGTPNIIDIQENRILWVYDESYLTFISFDKNYKVNGWRVNDDELNVSIGEAERDSQPFNILSSDHDVIKAMGTPFMLYKDETMMIWYYGFGNNTEVSSVVFNVNGIVVGWDNIQNNLKVHMGNLKNNCNFIIGSSEEEVLDAMGTPNRVFTHPYLSEDDYEIIWYYGHGNDASTVWFSAERIVSKWDNKQNNLNVSMGNKSKNTKTVHKGSTMQDVVMAMGVPDRAELNRWYYGKGTEPTFIQFDNNGKVAYWEDKGGLLTISKPITLGSIGKEVLDTIGYPDRRVFDRGVIWYYGDSYIVLNSTYSVVGWDNSKGELYIDMGSMKLVDYPISIGLTMQEVVDIMGTPMKVVNKEAIYFYYGNSFIKFNEIGKVSVVANNDYNLVLPKEEKKEPGKPIKLGSTEQDVYDAMGFPVSIYSFDSMYYWLYKEYCYDCYVVLDGSGFVVGWNNVNNNINIYMGDPIKNNKEIEKGMTEQEVIDILGTPISIYPTSVSISFWSYNISNRTLSITFDNEKKVRAWE